MLQHGATVVLQSHRVWKSRCCDLGPQPSSISACLLLSVLTLRDSISSLLCTVGRLLARQYQCSFWKINSDNPSLVFPVLIIHVSVAKYLLQIKHLPMFWLWIVNLSYRMKIMPKGDSWLLCGSSFRKIERWLSS